MTALNERVASRPEGEPGCGECNGWGWLGPDGRAPVTCLGIDGFDVVDRCPRCNSGREREETNR